MAETPRREKAEKRQGKQSAELNFGGAAGGGPPVRVRPDGVPVLTPTPTKRVVLPVQ